MYKKPSVFIMTSLWFFGILVSCSPSQSDYDARATVIADEFFSTQTAEAPTKTAVPTSTPLATPDICTKEEATHYINLAVKTHEKAEKGLADSQILTLDPELFGTDLIDSMTIIARGYAVLNKFDFEAIEFPLCAQAVYESTLLLLDVYYQLTDDLINDVPDAYDIYVLALEGRLKVFMRSIVDLKESVGIRD